MPNLNKILKMGKCGFVGLELGLGLASPSIIVVILLLGCIDRNKKVFGDNYQVVKKSKENSSSKK